MRAVLAFAPCVNPTYIPLGIASLSAYVKAVNPECDLRIIDLNIATWNRLIDRKEEYVVFRDFMQGRQKGFFDETQYRTHQATLKELVEIHDSYIQWARLYLEQNTLIDEFQRLLDYHSGLMMANDPEFIGFSVMYPSQILISLALAKFIHTTASGSAGFKRRQRIVMGGAMISALQSEEILKACPFVDAVFDGEGEAGLQMLCAGQNFSEIPGLVYRGTAGVMRNRKPNTLSLARLPLPAFTELNFSSYLNPEPVIPVIFSRGCKWRKCRFCAHNFSYSGYRRRNTAEFVDYLSGLSQRAGVRHFYFADQYVEATDMKILAEEILNRGLNIYFQIMGRPTDTFSPEILKTLFQAGCRWISWGVESGSQRLLDVCQKGTSAEAIRKVIRASCQAGISNLLMLIFGLPTSREEDFNATMELLDDLGDSTDAVTNSCFQLFDKTIFANQSEMFGLKITGREMLFDCEHDSVHSLRLFYQEKADDGTARPPQGPLELARWEHRRHWTSPRSIMEDLCCEHYLLYAAHRSNIGPASHFTT